MSNEKPEERFAPFETKISVVPVIDFVLCMITIPDKVVEAINTELDQLMLDAHRTSHSPLLVGQVKKGEQLSLSRENPVFAKVYSLVENAALAYVESFGTCTNLTAILPWVSAHCRELWSVHMFAGDYNPMHDHGTNTEAGLSFVLWTRVPDNMRNAEATDLLDSSGLLDGCIRFTNGPYSQHGPKQFRPGKALDIIPEPGKLVIFPHWLNHMVYPFAVPGERTTVSGNIDLFN